MQSDVVIETQNLTKVYRDFWGRQKVRALKALDLEVRRGEVFGLLKISCSVFRSLMAFGEVPANIPAWASSSELLFSSNGIAAPTRRWVFSFRSDNKTDRWGGTWMAEPL